MLDVVFCLFRQLPLLYWLHNQHRLLDWMRRISILNQLLQNPICLDLRQGIMTDQTTIPNKKNKFSGPRLLTRGQHSTYRISSPRKTTSYHVTNPAHNSIKCADLANSCEANKDMQRNVYFRAMPLVRKRENSERRSQLMHEVNSWLS